MQNLTFSPLFWPVKLKKDYLLVLDETKIPQKIVYVKVKNYQQAISAIKTMKTRAVGQVLLVLYTFVIIYRLYKDKELLSSKIKEAADSFNSARPTLAFKYLTDMVLAWQNSGISLEEKILSFLELLKTKRIDQAHQVSELIESKDTILTHCNLSGLIPLAADFSRRQNKYFDFLVTETRPYLQGVRLTAWELARQNFDVTVICDNMVAQVMHEGKIDKVIVGADNLALNGDIANKIGTYQIALLAKQFQIPFYVVCPPSSSAKEGKDIKIEIRSEKELFNLAGRSIATKGVGGYYPAFDITPNNLITKHIYMEV